MDPSTTTHPSQPVEIPGAGTPKPARFIQTVVLVQGIYFVLTGIWPLLGIHSFQMVTGPKTDLWLVKTVGLLVAVIGSVLVVAALRRQITPEILLLAIASAGGLAAVDVVYVATRTISAIYLLDAIVELILPGCLVYALFRGAQGPGVQRRAVTAPDSV